MKRQGFTLIELLIVMGIIALIAAMVFVAVSGLITSSRESATETTIKKINGTIYSRSGDIHRYFVSENKKVTRKGIRGAPPSYVTEPNELEMWKGTGAFAGAANPQLAEMLAQKRFVRSAFPMSFAEAGITAPASHNPDTEVAEVLYHFLTESFAVGDDPPRALSLSASEIRDTDRDGLMEVVDAWGNPLRFYRWPTRMIRPQPAGSEGTPQDDSGPIVSNADDWFMAYAEYSDSMRYDMDPDDELAALVAARDSGFFTSEWFERNYHTIETWHNPLVVSAGPDGELGLFEPLDIANRGDLGQPNFARNWSMEDDISSWELSSTAR